ncbi:MAG TPA: MFS transporter [Pseudonocardiaceae bacterium]|nr:MFS transporter [Pseudonocardiaceae bacterium]
MTASRPAVRPEQENTKTAGAATVVLAMCLGLMISMFNSTLVNVMVPAIGDGLHASATELEWVSAVYTLTYGALLLLGGALGNRFGRRTAFLAGIAVFVLGSLGCAFAPGIGVLLAGRVVQAVGVAVMLPQTLSILVHEFADQAARARAIGVWAGVSSLGLGAGPVLGGVILSVSSWRAGFVLSVALGMITLVLGLLAIPAARHGRPDSGPGVDYPGAALGAVCLAALIYGLLQTQTLGWASPVIIGSFVVAVLALGVFVATQYGRERRGANPLMPLSLWRSRHLVAASVAGLAYFFMFFGILYFYSIDLQQSRGYSALVTGLLFLPMMACIAAFGPIAGWLAARWTSARVLVLGLALGALGAFLLSQQGSGAGVLDLEWRFAIIGIASGFMSSSMSNLAVSSVAARYSSTAAAIHNTFRQIGSTLGVAALGVVIAATHPSTPSGPRATMTLGLDHATAVIAALLLASAIAVLALTARPRQPPATAGS